MNERFKMIDLSNEKGGHFPNRSLVNSERLSQ